MSSCSPAQGARGKMDVSIDTTHFRLTSRRHGWEQVAECIRQERIVKLWMHFRAARAARDAREPYRRERAYFRSGSRPRSTIERSVPRAPRVPKLGCVARQLSARVLAYAHSYLTSSRPSLGIPGTPASCWGRRESHLDTILVCAPLSKQL